MSVVSRFSFSFVYTLGRDHGFRQVQCNVFDGFAGEIALTAGGGRRGLPLLKDTFEDVALVSLVTLDGYEHVS